MKTGKVIEMQGQHYTVMNPCIRRGQKGWMLWAHSERKQIFVSNSADLL